MLGCAAEGINEGHSWAASQRVLVKATEGHCLAAPQRVLVKGIAWLPHRGLVLMRSGGGFINLDDVSFVVVDGFWSASCRGQFLICRIYHISGMHSQHKQDFVGLLCPVPPLLCAFAACLPWCLSAQPHRTVLSTLPLATRLFCVWLARARFWC